MKFGKNIFCENNIFIKKLKPTLEDLAGHDEKENVHFAGCCTFDREGLHLCFNYLDNPHVDEYICRFDGNSFEMRKVKDAEFCYNAEMRGVCL